MTPITSFDLLLSFESTDYVTPYTKILEHHGLVAGFCHTLGFADIIDNALGGVAPERKVNCGQLVTAMVLNGLGFTGRTLHMYSEYFRNKPLDRLIGEGVQPVLIGTAMEPFHLRRNGPT